MRRTWILYPSRRTIRLHGKSRANCTSALPLHERCRTLISTLRSFAARSSTQKQHSMERMMHPSGDFLSTPALDYEGWRDALRPHWGRSNPEVVAPKTFAGRARPRSLFGFVAMDLSCNAHLVARTQRDVRLDGVDHYFALFQVAGGSTIIQNDQAVQLVVGDAVLVDSAQPGTHVSDDRCGQWISLQLPRRSLLSHLGVDLRGGIMRRAATAAGRVLFDLVRDTDTSDESAFSPADSYIQLAFYELFCALLAP